MIDILTALINLIIHGDYTPQLNTIGWAEDHAMVDFILTSTGR